MLNLKNFCFSLIILTVLSIATIAQAPPPPVSLRNSNSPADNRNRENFTSLDGGFTIALPLGINGFEGIKPNDRMKGGSQFTWRLPEGFFIIGYAELNQKPENAKQELQTAGDNLIAKVDNSGGKSINTKEIALYGNPGVEITVRLKEGLIGVTRYFLVNARMYILSSGWAEKENGATQLKILDSFRLIDGKAIIAKKLAEATPAALPQTPAAKKLKSDAAEDGLKGAVKSVIEEEEDLTGTWSVAGIKMSSEDYYNERGNKLKRILYDYKGNPSTVAVYGYIDGLRVSIAKDLNYEYNPPLAVIPLSSAKPKPVAPKAADARYQIKYEYKYDDKGRLIETVKYRNTGELSVKTVYIYDGNKIEESNYDRDGKLTGKTIQEFDENGNLTAKTFVHTDSRLPDTKYTYSYVTFDDKGNWTKRIVYGKEGRFGGGYKDQHYIEYRKITYHPFS